MIAKIAVERLIYSIDRPYSYRIPSDLSVMPGMRAAIPFGRGNKVAEGMVLSVEQGEDPSLKEILYLLDREPVMSERMLRLAAFVRERYFCTFYDAIRAMLPAGLWLRSRERLELNELPADWEDRLAGEPLMRGVVCLIREAGGSMSLDGLTRQLGGRQNLSEAVGKLRDWRWLRSSTEILKKNSDKTEKLLRCTASREQIETLLREKAKSAPMQAAVMELLGTVDCVSLKELQYFTGASMATIRTLERNGLLEIELQEVLRRSKIVPTDQDVSFRLNEEQNAVFDALLSQMNADKPGAALLYGITGSGKTAVYINLIRACLAQGRTALLMVPEIALTPQLLSLFSACFGSDIAVLHSALRAGERYDEFKRIQRGEAKVVVGTRSAVFAPLVNPGLLILDEEQEHTYKSENTPRYHAREVALYRGVRENALVLMGSATPSVETMYLARAGVYRLYRLENRFNGRDLPNAELVDMKQELIKGNQSAVSRRLLDLIRDRISKKEKTILLLNRRGGNRLLVCVDCGCVPECPRCSVHLTYHMANDRLMCHYCGFSQPAPDVCPECGGHLKRVGFGTQQLEYDLREALPGTEILRMDADTITPTNPHEKVLRRFEKEDIPILIGTQMVAKGLNFEDVTLVGVVDADMSLYVDHFRASETTFSLVTQVVGRSGRGRKKGSALIQTMTPQNKVLRLAARQDYDRFYDLELPLRKLRKCPPYQDLIQIGFSGFPEQSVETAARAFADSLWAEISAAPWRDTVADLLGPAPAPVSKINNKYRYRLTLCCKNTREMRLLLSEQIKAFSRQKQNRGVSVYVDVNGYES